MGVIVLNVALSSALISLAVYLSRTNPTLGGFVVSLPLSTLIALALARLQGGGAEPAFQLARSVFVAVPATLVFFVPFLLAPRLRLGFWTCYASGVALLVAAYFIHRAVLR